MKAAPLLALALGETTNRLHVPTALPPITSSRYPVEIKLCAFTGDTGMNLVVMIIVLWFHSGRVYLTCPGKDAQWS